MESAFTASFFSASIAVNLMAAVLVYATGRLVRQTLPYYSLVTFFLCVALYQYSSWQYHTAKEVMEATFWLRLQIYFVLINIPIFYYCFSVWSDQKTASNGYISLCLVALVFALMNWFMPYSLKFSEISGLAVIELHNNEYIHVLKGELSFVAKAYYGFIFGVLIWISFKLQPLLSTHLRGFAIALCSFVFLQTFAASMALLIDQGVLSIFYLTGFTTTILVILLCFNIAHQVHLQSQRLQRQVRKNKQVKQAIDALAGMVSDSTSRTFFEQITITLQRLFKVDIALIGLYKKDKHVEWVECLAIVDRGRLIPNIDYELKNTPCEQVKSSGISVIQEGAKHQFPHDRMLLEKDIEFYVGIPLIHKNEQPIGLITLMHTKPQKISEEMRQTLTVFAARASAEIHRNQMEQQLRHMAYFDYTTALPNRAQLFELINELYKENTKTFSHSILLLFDLDRFKDINRIFGYDTAESALKELGNRLNHYASNNVFVARNDGDEFAILIKNIDTEPNGLIEVNWQAIQAIIKAPIIIDERSIKLECSMGAVVFPDQTGSRFDVVRSAETALQQAKRSGRGRYAIFDPELQRRIDHRVDIESKLRHALTVESELYIVFQPITDQHGNAFGCEVLVRWKHPRQGIVPTFEFIRIAEESGLIIPLSRWIINKTFKTLQSWKNRHIPLPAHVSINISALQLSEDEFVEDLIGLADIYDIAHNTIVLELTESGLLEDIDNTKRQLSLLRKTGFRIALDDFGTGYSSLSYLRDLPLDIIKIDRSFVIGLFQSGTREVVESIMVIGKHMHLEIIAEGTETIQQIDALTQMGCKKFQGFYFSPPLEEEDYLKWKFHPID